MRRSPRTPAAGLVAAALALTLAGCAPGGPAPVPSAAPLSSASARPSISPSDVGPVQPVGEPTVLASGLKAPWSILRLDAHLTDGGGGSTPSGSTPSGSTLISGRDDGVIKELTASGTLRDAGTVAGVVHSGEGGLLGLDARSDGDTTWIYAYYTSTSDNRIVRMALIGTPGHYSFGDQHNILTGLAKAGNHDGGRIKFGPDGHLYATVGDAGQGSRAQDKTSLNGKILRMNPDGSVPDDNPFPGSLVYTLGHRNPQGIAWDSEGRMWASEFGQNTWDELNIISPGQNYGWPIHEGVAEANGYADPVKQWSTAQASPSGLAIVHDSLFMAALRGQRLWAIYPGPASVEAVSWFEGDYGRLRDAVPGPNGTLWILTNNTDGRGNPRQGDDRLVQIQLGSHQEG
ncbi:MAG: PQQ-dependent sugar dehydrogenase [Terrimesophilobacter sp.]